MTSDQPSFLHSTTSLLLVLAVAGFVVGNLSMLWISKGQAGLGGLESLISVLLPLYAARKGGEMVKNGTLTPPPTQPGG